MIVPMLGFTPYCDKLSKSSIDMYDRTIPKLNTVYNKKVLTIGVAYEAQKFTKDVAHHDYEVLSVENKNPKIAGTKTLHADDLFITSVDWIKTSNEQQLDYVVTEDRVYKKIGWDADQSMQMSDHFFKEMHVNHGINQQQYNEQNA